MKELIEKLRSIEINLSKKKGRFTLFGLFQSENTGDKWDLLIAAPWININDTGTLKLIATSVQEALTPEEIVMIQRIALIDDKNPALNALQMSIHAEHGGAEFVNCNFFGFLITHAFIITSQK